MPEKKLNPDITSVWVGIEEVREVKVYPLSIKDHTEKVPQILVGAYSNLQEKLEEVEDFKNLSEEEGKSIMDKFKEILLENVRAILELVVKKEERPTEEELTSNQLFEFAEKIFVVNYEGVLKNSIDLFKRVQSLREKA